jgi:hypothetical protein
MPPFPVDAFAHSTVERRLRPGADTGRGIRRDVGGIDRPERRRKGQAAGKNLAAGFRITDDAVADGGKRLALQGSLGIETSRRRCWTQPRSLTARRQRRS